MSITNRCGWLLRTRFDDLAGAFWERPGYKEAKRALASFQKAAGQGVPYIPMDLTSRRNNKLDPTVQEYLGWISFHWAEHFAAPQNSERQQPSSSSSSCWSPSPTWWVKFVILLPKLWHSYGWQDPKWSDRRYERQSWIHAPKKKLLESRREREVQRCPSQLVSSHSMFSLAAVFFFTDMKSATTI